MAVYERTYKRWSGETTSEWSRFLILPRYVVRDVFKSRWMVAFFVLCFIFPLYSAAVIYVRHSTPLLELLPQLDLQDFLAIDERFFATFLRVQSWFAFFLALFVGPGLVSRDLANNGLPLYLSRPFSRYEYILGRFTVLAVLLSAVTWVPGLLLMVMQVNFEGFAWLGEHPRLVPALLLGSGVWIVLLSLLALAISAWVRWRPIAGFTMLLVLLGGLFFGQMVNRLFRTDFGHLLNPAKLVAILWTDLLAINPGSSVPVWSAWLVVAGFLGVCLFVLDRRIRAYEVVR
ncbi:MAG: hypothetical protein AAGN66_00135 [Acidobacteriota bacterium]